MATKLSTDFGLIQTARNTIWHSRIRF